MEHRELQGTRPVIPEIDEQARKLWEIAIRRGLDPYPVRFEVVDGDEINELAAYAGYPVRYHHWRFGQESLKMKKTYRFGLQRIYEMVIATNPSYAYLLDVNPLAVQKEVIAHVYGHTDFFKNNVWFSQMPTDLHNRFGDNAARIEAIRREVGKELVDIFLENCISASTLCDMMSEVIYREKPPEKVSEESPKLQFKEKLPDYMDKIVNPPEWLEAKRLDSEFEKEIRSEVERGVLIPAKPVRDVLGFFLKHAPLEKWQKEVMRIIKEEEQYLMKVGLTKIMNEGWAAFWQAEIMAGEPGVTKDSEILFCARMAAGVQRPSRRSLNPYSLGLQLWQSIKYRWDTGRHGLIWTECEYKDILDRWDEFVVFKAILEKHDGVFSPEAQQEWFAFSALIFETKAGRGVYPQGYFYPENYATEWLSYQNDSRYDELRKRIGEGATDAKSLSIPESWLVWADRNQLTGGLGKGLEKMLEVRRTHHDVAFIQDFFTEDFCEQHDYFIYGVHDPYGGYDPEYMHDARLVIKTREFRRVRRVIINQILNLGLPKIVLWDANYEDGNELLFVHLHDGRDLSPRSVRLVLQRLYFLWGMRKDVHLETAFTQWPAKDPWWRGWRPPGEPQPKPMPPKRVWGHYKFDGNKHHEPYKVAWDEIEDEIKAAVPVFRLIEREDKIRQKMEEEAD